ncbi:aminotransferase class I/II-fold pyridoxal phosphate-dependent enzyme [Paenibacillus contaminans]|uniref:Aminotransferase n=1 Tax=Paenibacillus contaminans TaxID=450362 RepID=A0A329MU84_9BACL|nr:aminotransferase class I/II-fold pyridoxal phosphate-dependent enzyme [Paenibacillus contaminans]RAV22898.1 aminotransferase [Paenibacillus contaminans]
MSEIHALGETELQERLRMLQEKYDGFMQRRLKLDMSRGKPSPEQLQLSMGMLDAVTSADGLLASDGTDTRNYGGLDGIPEAKALFAQILEVSPQEIVIGGSSSLTMMHDAIARAMLFGVDADSTPWGKRSAVKFLCPSPGYDRHFAICELFGIEMIAIDMFDDGPDMDTVERLAGEDDSIKGIWCVPKYSNPDGLTYSDDVVDRLARMKTKAGDFRIMWDNAYAVHHLTERADKLKNIFAACRDAGNPDRVLMFSSTSKISFAGSGIAVMAASERNLNVTRKQLSVQTIGPDKVNQLRHVRFFEHISKLESHMAKHASILKPKFDLVLNMFERELDGKGVATWRKPNGGYFISLNTLDGCAVEVVKLAAEAGVTLTKAGATFPYGTDPRDRNIRIAPSYPTLAELETAIEVICVCVEIASIKKIMG